LVAKKKNSKLSYGDEIPQDDPWHRLNFFPLSQGQLSLRRTPAYGS
jgi:hypothetical protein